MKQYEFNLDGRQLDLLFKPIRDKLGVINLLMNSMKIMIVNQEIPDDQACGKMLLIIDRMSRLFFESDNKIFSINFPFFVKYEDNRLIFYSNDIDDIDSKVTSDILAFNSSSGAINSYCIYEFIETIDELSSDSDWYWSLIKYLFLYEDGYIRYDFDPIHVNGNQHPLHHFDIFYSSQGTFKIGLNKKMDCDTLVDILDTKTDCCFIEI